MRAAAGVTPHLQGGPEQVTQDFAEPLLTANLYCHGRLDALITGVVLPFRREISRQSPETELHLWLLRYARGGEHLKVRIHGPESFRSTLIGSLQEKADQFFSEAGGPSETAPANLRPVPPIDQEDAEAGLHDHSLLWTHYQRSPIVLGPPPLLDDCRYVSLFTRCLCCGCEAMLPTFAASPPTHTARLWALLSLLATGVADLWQTPEERADYLVYHRNWLIRIPVLSRNLGEKKAQDILGRYEQAAAEFDLTRVAALEGRNPRNAWARALLDLQGYLRRLEDKAEFTFDPLAIGPQFPILFKVFHCMANQLGLNALNEGLAHHIALRALCPRSRGSFSLIPE